MKSNRTQGWWLTRFELAVAVLLIVTLVLVILSYPPADEERLVLGPLVVTAGTFTLAALPGAVVGLIWMLRIFRGPRDELPRWRYRDQ